jgi:hypothetical protein
VTDQIPERDWDKLTPEARSFLCMLAGERNGRVVEEVAEKLGRVTAAVRSFSFEDDNGNLKGPKGALTLQLTVGPATDNSPDTVDLIDKITCRYPEDRTHPMYVGHRNTLHTRQSTDDALFAVQVSDGAAEIEYPPDRAAGPDS